MAAAACLSIIAHRERNSIVASIPTHRVLIHAKRLLADGHRVLMHRVLSAKLCTDCLSDWYRAPE